MLRSSWLSTYDDRSDPCDGRHPVWNVSRGAEALMSKQIEAPTLRDWLDAHEPVTVVDIRTDDDYA